MAHKTVAAPKHGQDEAELAQIGKTQQLRRHFSFWSTIGLTASMMCTWEAVFFANSTALVNGGPVTLVYGFLYAVVGALATAASLAEMASMYPTSEYHYLNFVLHGHSIDLQNVQIVYNDRLILLQAGANTTGLLCLLQNAKRFT